MIDRLRVLVLLSRPPVLLLLGLFAATGFAQGGGGPGGLGLIVPMIVVVGYLLFSAIVNDLADEAIDRVNLPGVAARPLVTGAGSRAELRAAAAVAAAVTLAAAASIGPAALAVLVAGLALSAAYSLRPVRLSDRGAVASLLLPAGYVAVPYLTGLLAVRTHLGRADVVLLTGLYVGFIGRILLKDFRDVRGDALFGKRTFLVRHGRRWTCACSATAWVLGSLALGGVRDLSPALVVAQLVWVANALVLLRMLAADRGSRRDESLISALAIVGRGMVVTVVAHLGMTDAGWSRPTSAAILAAITGVVLGQAVTMARKGPLSRLRVPSSWPRPNRRETPCVQRRLLPTEPGGSGH